MTDDFKQFEDSIKKVHSFGWTPKFESEIHTSLNSKIVMAIVVKAIEKLDWEIRYNDELFVKADVKGAMDIASENVSITYDFGKLKIISEAAGNEYMDWGRNSKRVKLFIYAFEQTVKEFDREALRDLEIQVERANNWDDYEIPESLPQPKPCKTPRFGIQIIGGVLTAIIFGGFFAFLCVKSVYIVGLYEILVAFGLAFVLLKLIKLSHYTFFDNLHYLLISMILLTYIANQYFTYHISFSDLDALDFSFLEYIDLKWSNGLTVKGFNTGWIGLFLSWCVQLGFTYLFALIKLAGGVSTIQIERIPEEVVNFAYYHLIKGKTEDQINQELSKMGWSEAQDQIEVFEAIGAIWGAIEYNKEL